MLPFDAFLAATSPRRRRPPGRRRPSGGVSFDEAYRRLQKGRAYGRSRPASCGISNRTVDGVEHHYALNVPDSYDPARRYQVRIPTARRRRRRATNGRSAPAPSARLPAPSRSTSFRTRGTPRRGGATIRSLNLRGDSRRGQARLQRRREPRRRLRRLGRRHRRVLRRHARHDAVRELPAAERLLDGAREPRHRRRAIFRQQPAQQATLHRQRRPRSALPDARSSIRTSST